MENRKLKAMEMDRQLEVTRSYATACAEVSGVSCARKEHQVFPTRSQLIIFKLSPPTGFAVCTWCTSGLGAFQSRLVLLLVYTHLLECRQTEGRYSCVPKSKAAGDTRQPSPAPVHCFHLHENEKHPPTLPQTPSLLPPVRWYVCF